MDEEARQLFADIRQGVREACQLVLSWGKYTRKLEAVADAARAFVGLVRGLEWDDEEIYISTVGEFRAIEDALAELDKEG